MKDMLSWQGISRQAAHKGIARLGKYTRDLLDTFELADKVRINHPRMGCRDIYYSMQDQMPRGRDWTEKHLLEYGYRVHRGSKSFTRAGEHTCSNLIEGKTIDGPNQVWQTDITYYWCNNRWYYLSFIVDVYTREILASHCSIDLSSASQITCLKKAVKSQKGRDLSNLIVHSDRGIQYTCGEFKQYLATQGFKQSMAHYAWQNAYCERVNRTIKNNYLKPFNPKTYNGLCKGIAKAIRAYNGSKPHGNLPKRLAPKQFLKEWVQGEHKDYEVKIWSKLTSTNTLNIN